MYAETYICRGDSLKVITLAKCNIRQSYNKETNNGNNNKSCKTHFNVYIKTTTSAGVLQQTASSALALWQSGLV